jgi:peptide/nickel transport system substrate-binding protein/oligopeptide transport system substrate-binding protein
MHERSLAMKISKKILATSTIILSAITLAACGNQSASQKKNKF